MGGAVSLMYLLCVHLESLPPPPPQALWTVLMDRTGLSLGKRARLRGLSTSVYTVSGMHRPKDTITFQEKPAFKKFRRPPLRL